MEDADIIEQINQLAHEEHTLFEKESEGGASATINTVIRRAAVAPRAPKPISAAADATIAAHTAIVAILRTQ